MISTFHFVPVFFTLNLKTLIDPHSLMSGGNSFHSFAIRYLKDFCPFTLVKSGKFSWSDCLNNAKMKRF